MSFKTLTPQAQAIASSMAASEDEHPLLSAAVEVWRLEAQLKKVLNKRGVRCVRLCESVRELLDACSISAAHNTRRA